MVCLTGLHDSEGGSSGLVGLVGLEGDLQHAVSQPVPVQTCDSHGRLVVVRHGDEAEPFALVGVEVSDHLHIVDGAEWPEQLPQHAFVRVWGQVIDEDAPAGAGVPGNVHPYQTGHAIYGDGREPENDTEEKREGEREREESERCFGGGKPLFLHCQSKHDCKELAQ